MLKSQEKIGFVKTCEKHKGNVIPIILNACSLYSRFATIGKNNENKKHGGLSRRCGD